MTPRRSYWRAIADAQRDFDAAELDTARRSHGSRCECDRCWRNRLADMDVDLQPPVTNVKPEDAK